MDDQTITRLLDTVHGDQPSAAFVLRLRDELDDILDEAHANADARVEAPTPVAGSIAPPAPLEVLEPAQPQERPRFNRALAAAAVAVIVIGLAIVFSTRSDDTVTVLTASELSDRLVSESQRADTSPERRLALLAEATTLDPSAQNYALLGSELQVQGHLTIGSTTIPGVHDVSISSDGSRVITSEGFALGAGDIDFTIWDVDADTLQPLEFALSTAQTTTFLESGELVAIGQNQADREAYRLEDTTKPIAVTHVDDVSADGTVGLLVLSSDVFLLDMASGTELARSQILEPDSYRLNHNGTLVIASRPAGISAPARIGVWETDNPAGFTDQHPLASLGPPSALHVEFSSDGEWIAVGTQGRIDILEAATLDPRSSFDIGTGISRIDLSTDNGTLISYHETEAGQSVLRVWDVDTGTKLLNDIDLPSGTVPTRSSAASFDLIELAPDGIRLVIGHPDDGRIDVRELDRSEWITRACSASPVRLDPQELGGNDPRACR